MHHRFPPQKTLVFFTQVANDVVPGPITLKVGVTDAKQAEIEATVAAVYGGATSISMTTGGYIFNDGKFVRMLKKAEYPFCDQNKYTTDMLLFL